MTSWDLWAVDIRSVVQNPSSSDAHTGAVMALLGQRESASSALINGVNWMGLPVYLCNEAPPPPLPPPLPAPRTPLSTSSRGQSRVAVIVSLWPSFRFHFVTGTGVLYRVRVIPQVVKAAVPHLPPPMDRGAAWLSANDQYATVVNWICCWGTRLWGSN